MKKTYFLLLLLLAACRNANENITLEKMVSSGNLIDLSYDFSEKTPYWPNNPTGFKLDTQFNGITTRGFYYASNEFRAPEHGGTHLDAPAHFAKGKWTLDQIPMEALVGQACVIDVSSVVKDDSDYLVRVDDIKNWEAANGKLTEGSMVFIRTGWGKYYPDAARYLGSAGKGTQAIAQLHFPAVDPQTVSWLLENRNIKALGVDVASVDYGQSKDFKVHQLLCAENKPGFENVANLEKLPAKGAYVFALPMKIKDGTGGPLRLMAWVKK
jgi:kynurenine formamidase